MVAARAVLSLALLFSAEAALAAADVEARREVALTWCASCHVVGAAKPHGGIHSTPSFFLMSEIGRTDRTRRRTHRSDA